MCGISGFVDFSGHCRIEARARIQAMTDVIAHRGPDGEGFYVDDFAAFGHRRLAIIDVASGQQPMGACNGQVQIVFNGEIYNFLDVRGELEAKSYVFRTHCDTETILFSYLEWGERCVERLHGMFAFAIWDGRSKSLLLARDRVGKKPLYYCRVGSVVAFASELKALRAGGLCPSEIDPEALDCYFCFGYIPAPRTIYRRVSKLRAARSLLVSANHEVERQYWRMSFADPVERSMEDVVAELEPLLDDAVKRRLMSEVPLGAFLSGGLDSSLVVASMARLTDRPVVTNSIGFEDRELDELSVARQTAAYLCTEHHEFVVAPRAASVLQKIAWHFDEPLADSSAVSTWYVCEMARRTVTVALSGDGGDEAFGGYTFRYLPHRVESLVRGALSPALRGAVFGGLGALWPASARLPRALRLKTVFENLAVSDAEAFYHDLIWLREDTRTHLYSPEFLAELKGFTPFEAVYSYYVENDAPDALARAQSADIHFYMTDDVLAKVDRMSMAHSLEVRCPLLDHRVLEFAAKLPGRLKMDGRRGKLPLRALAAIRLPGAVLAAPKRGFSVPAARWLRQELRTLAEDLLFDRNSTLACVLDRRALRTVWEEHQSRSRDHSVLIWGLMMLGLWERAISFQPAARTSDHEVRVSRVCENRS
jgi:asparagine synthase (glutamine-hydrolysing)